MFSKFFENKRKQRNSKKRLSQLKRTSSFDTAGFSSFKSSCIKELNIPLNPECIDNNSERLRTQDQKYSPFNNSKHNKDAKYMPFTPIPSAAKITGSTKVNRSDFTKKRIAIKDRTALTIQRPSERVKGSRLDTTTLSPLHAKNKEDPQLYDIIDAANKTELFIRSAKENDLQTMVALAGENKAIVYSLKDDENWTALHHAVWQENANMVKYLLSLNINPDPRADHGITPLMIAASKGLPRIAKLLISNGSDRIMKDEFGNIFIHYAVMNNMPEFVKVFVDDLELFSIRNNKGVSAMNICEDAVLQDTLDKKHAKCEKKRAETIDSIYDANLREKVSKINDLFDQTEQI